MRSEVDVEWNGHMAYEADQSKHIMIYLRIPREKTCTVPLSLETASHCELLWKAIEYISARSAPEKAGMHAA